MGNKIITEKDFWVCSGGTTPAQLQSRQTAQWVKKESGHKFITVADTATSSWIDFGCKKLMWIMAILAAVIAVAVVATGGAALGALIAAGAMAGAAGAAFGAVVGALICGQKAAAARKWLSSKPDLIIKGQQAITGDNQMKCMLFDATITFAPNIKNWWQAIALSASNYIGGILEGMMYGAAVGAAGGIISGGPAVLGEFGVSNLGANWLATWGGWGLGLRGVVTAQSVLGAYGENGQVTAHDVVYSGVFGMETGTLHSAQNILSGKGTMTDVIGLGLWFIPAHTARNQSSSPTTKESSTKSGEGKSEEGKDEENHQARTGESKTTRQQGEFEAYEEGANAPSKLLTEEYVDAVAKFKSSTPKEVTAFYEGELASGIDHRVLIDKALEKYPSLTRAEAEAIYGYTGKQWYRDFNRALENGGTPEAEQLSGLLRSGVDKMPNSPSTTQYRGIRLNTPDDIAAFDSKFAVGKEVTSNSYWSTAPSPSDAYPAQRNLVIDTTSAKDISDLAFGVNFHDKVGKPVYSNETIIPPGVNYKVTRVDKATGTVFLKEIK
ncbi:MAG: hypothetical protein J2P21_11345 [Chloracidobacterium sp.]|nr:hypothetical protein [Chloracidobacterium sp.]